MITVIPCLAKNTYVTIANATHTITTGGSKHTPQSFKPEYNWPKMDFMPSGSVSELQMAVHQAELTPATSTAEQQMLSMCFAYSRFPATRRLIGTRKERLRLTLATAS